MEDPDSAAIRTKVFEWLQCNAEISEASGAPGCGAYHSRYQALSSG